MQKIVLIATEKPFAPDARDAAVEIIQSAGLEVRILENYKTNEKLVDALRGVNAVVVRSDEITQDIIDDSPNLELIVRGGAGYDNIDHVYAQERSIVVENTPEMNSIAVAEIAFQFMHNILRPLNGKIGNELRGKRLSLHGFGKVGERVAHIAGGYGMQIKAYDPLLTEDKAKDFGVTMMNSPEELYKDADIVSLHIPKTPQTIGSIGYGLLSLMSKKGILINTARAEIIDEESLLEILKERPHFRYYSDIAPSKETQQRIIDNFKDRVFWTPKKQGAQTHEANYDTMIQAAEQIVGFFNNGKIINAVNSPIPADKKDYTTLAELLGRFNKAFIGQPNKVRVICYGELDQYKESLAQYVLKGLFQNELGRGLRPGEALNAAKSRGIALELLDPKNEKGHGNSITIDYFTSDGQQHSIRGRVDEGDIQINRIGDFRINIPLVKGVYVIAEYDEQIGMADRIGEALSSSGFNKIEGGFMQDNTGERAMTFYRIDMGNNRFETLNNILKTNIKTIKGMNYAAIIDLM